MTRKEKIEKIVEIRLKDEPSVSDQTKQWCIDMVSKMCDVDIQRELQKIKKKELKVPELIDDSLINLKPLRNKLQDYINWIPSNEYQESESAGWEEDIYVIVMETYFGKDIWEFFKKI